MTVVIALLVLLGIFGASMVVISGNQHSGFGLDLQGVRAYHAARGALEWGAYHVLRTGYGGCAGIDGKSIDFTGNLAGFRATLACSQSAHNESGAAMTVYSVTATACNAAVCPAGGSPAATYVERQLRAMLSK